MNADFSNYKLVDLGQGHYRLVPTFNTLGNDVRISFLPGGYVAIYGDLCPGRVRHDNKGIFSVVSKGEPWFRGNLSERYLAEKFGLEQVFRPDYAEKYCRERADDLESDNPVDAGSYLELAEMVTFVNTRDDGDVNAWLEDLRDLETDSDGIEACYGYDQDNLDLLVGIHRAMVRLREEI
jgi:hypothetical protein